ncbi:MAG TPA: DUF4132 domain-containing protein [Vicinamibacterales bacterium]|nr:DUF4132 domain-containing protein [Vicinamibacterales bacterium]
MADAAQQARLIYDAIRATSADRPFAFQSLEQLRRGVADWQAQNPALASLRQAPPDVQTAFLSHSVEWLKHESADHANFRIVSTLVDAILHAISAAPKPLSPELTLKLLSELRREHFTRQYFPLDQFLAVLQRGDVTDDIRAELRRLQPQYAPSPTGKIDERALGTHNRIAELIYVEGEKTFDQGRGPWSQMVFDEIAGTDDITRFGWQALLEHCRALEQTVPGTTWKARARELMAALGESNATNVTNVTNVPAALRRWLALGPTPGQPPEARSPIEDSAYQKGVVWCLALTHDPAAASGVGDFAIACLRKIPMLGAVSQKVGFACTQALGSMECSEAVGQLTRLRAKVTYTVARRLIEKSLREAAERNGLTVGDLEDLAVPWFALDAEGASEQTLGDTMVTSRVSDTGEVTTEWRNAEGKLLKSVPSHIKKAFPGEVKTVSALAKELEQAYLGQRYRLESSFAETRTIAPAHWRRHFIDHPLLGLMGRRLIWVFSNDQGWERSGLYSNGELRDSQGEIIDLAPATKVRLWHPLSSEPSELLRWRERVFTAGIRQPFRQAFREFYRVTEDESRTTNYSNRFAGISMRQHQFSSLCRARGWSYRLMGTGFDGFNVPTKILAPWNMHVEFYVDLPPDRDEALRDSALGKQSASGINLFLGSDQVRFYRNRREIAVDDVPAIVYSEVMRDVDLFTTVSAAGEAAGEATGDAVGDVAEDVGGEVSGKTVRENVSKDPSWSDQGERGTGVLAPRLDVDELAAIIALRADMLSRVLPLTPIASRCRIEKHWLEVHGELGTYRILFLWGTVIRITDSSAIKRLTIPLALLEAVSTDFAAFPIDLDFRTEQILRKAFVLANDGKIDSPDLIRQL